MKELINFLRKIINNKILSKGASPIIVYLGLPITKLVLHNIGWEMKQEFWVGPVLPNFEENQKNEFFGFLNRYFN